MNKARNNAEMELVALQGSTADHQRRRGYGASDVLRAAAVGFLLHVGAANAQLPADTKFISSAVENLDGTVTFPAYSGTSGGQIVYYIVTEASDATMAAQLGVNYAPKLKLAAGTNLVQSVSSNSPPYNFPGTVTFNSGARSISPATGVLSPTPTGVAPAQGGAAYSPLVQLANGIVLNAPHIQNSSGRHPKLVSFDTATSGVATFIETNGFQGGQPVRYISTDASTAFLAAAENSTFAPKLQADPISLAAVHADLALIDDGQRGFDNVERQGFDSAVLDGLDPLNILAANPAQPSEYSPLWGVNPLRWNAGSAVKRLQDLNLARASAVTAIPLTGTVGDQEPVVNCPIVARRSASVISTVTPKLSRFLISYSYLSSNFNRYIMTATVVDGANGDAPLSGVLVGVKTDYLLSESCTTNSSGICTFTRTLVAGERDGYYVTTLNRSTQAPGIRNSRLSLNGPSGTPAF
jgi:hypothetical protein